MEEFDEVRFRHLLQRTTFGGDRKALQKLVETQAAGNKGASVLALEVMLRFWDRVLVLFCEKKNIYYEKDV
jgi:hypothetical protein